jgi:hypothetical protein
MNLKGASAGFFALGQSRRSEPASTERDDKWIRFRNRWECSHVLRAVLSALALISLIVAVAVRT